MIVSAENRKISFHLKPSSKFAVIGKCQRSKVPFREAFLASESDHFPEPNMTSGCEELYDQTVYFVQKICILSALTACFYRSKSLNFVNKEPSLQIENDRLIYLNELQTLKF